MIANKNLCIGVMVPYYWIAIARFHLLYFFISGSNVVHQPPAQKPKAETKKRLSLVGWMPLFGGRSYLFLFLVVLFFVQAVAFIDAWANGISTRNLLTINFVSFLVFYINARYVL
jgi:hypothetical protein